MLHERVFQLRECSDNTTDESYAQFRRGYTLSTTPSEHYRNKHRAQADYDWIQNLAHQHQIDDYSSYAQIWRLLLLR